MRAAVDQNLRPRETDKRQITDQVKKLMAHRFIGIAQWWIQPVVTITDQGIVEGTPLDQTRSTELVHLLTEAEGTRRCDLGNKAFRSQHQSTLLTTDGRLGKVNHPDKHELISGRGGDHTAAAVQSDRLLELRPSASRS